MSTGKTVCIIGAGVSGLPAINYVLIEVWAVQYGVEPTVFDAQSQLGGLWKYKEAETEFSTVSKHCVINTSKELTCYSDFVPQAEDANYMHNTNRYADTFNLRQYIRFNHRVTNVERARDYDTTGRWVVSYTDNNGTPKQQTFDFVLVCNGHHATPKMPEPWPGQDKWKGRMIHSHSYKKCTNYEDKNVLIVGIGNSAVDVASELTNVAKQVTMSTRNGTWVVSKHIERGYPLDMYLNSRVTFLKKWLNIEKFNNDSVEKFSNFFDQDEYGSKPKHKFWSQQPTISDDLHNKISSGTIVLKGDIKCFTENGVIFEDGSFTEVDEVICCTGFKFDFLFLDFGKLVPVVDIKNELYKKSFPLNSADKNTLAIIGLYQLLGSIFAPAELNIRVFFEQALGHIKLPSKTNMIKDIEASNKRTFNRYANIPRNALQIDYVEYTDEMADLIGCKPPMTTLFFTDYTLWKILFFGPNVPYAYRLVGPHSWPKARETILTVQDRRIQAIHKRQTPNNPLEKCLELNKEKLSPAWITVGAIVLLGVSAKLYQGGRFDNVIDSINRIFN